MDYTWSVLCRGSDPLSGTTRGPAYFRLAGRKRRLVFRHIVATRVNLVMAFIAGGIGVMMVPWGIDAVGCLMATYAVRMFSHSTACQSGLKYEGLFFYYLVSHRILSDQ